MFLASGLVLIAGFCCNNTQTKLSDEQSRICDTCSQKSRVTSLPNSTLSEQSSSTSDEQIISLCKNFYIGYITEISEGTLVNMEKNLDSIKQIYCTNDLLENIRRKTENNEMDIDPFIKAQDANIKWLKTLTVEKDTQKRYWYMVSYIDNYDEGKVIINLKFIKENGFYKIDSIE
jgi:hypothetical protein